MIENNKIFVHGFTNQRGRFRLTSCTKHDGFYELGFRNGNNGSTCYPDNGLTFKTGTGQYVTVEQAHRIINNVEEND